MAERNYEFRRRLGIIHKPDRRVHGMLPEANEIEVTDEWQIVIDNKASALIYNVARDFEDYLMVSMGISVKLVRVENICLCRNTCTKSIILATKSQLAEQGEKPDMSRSYRLTIRNDCIIICGYDGRGTAQGSYYIEDLMNMREAPYLTKTDEVREPIFSPRMVHSGWGIDEFPDVHLNAIAHAGMDAILLFVNGVDSVPGAYRGTLSGHKICDVYKDFNDLIRRASLFGIDVYMYSYLESDKHPDDPDAEEYYDSTYGRIFRECPGFKGVVLVGESCEFPSKDTNTSMVMRKDLVKLDVPPSKPCPGWWPCRDYPLWLNIIRKVIKKYNSNADIVFWTYNWGWAPEESRAELIKNIPEGITLLVTFEMFEVYERNGLKNRCVDYTLSFEGPGRYFSSEAKVAHECGLKLYAMSNTGGLTWDIGVIPYEPAPYQWIRRHKALKKVQENWSLSGLMESHHFGWQPSFISEIAKWSFWTPSLEPDKVCRNLAKRDFSEEAVPFVLKAWHCWSEAFRCYIPTNEDQYGPFRVGPSFPLSLKHLRNIPSMEHARFGNIICEPEYNPPDRTRAFNGAHMEKEIDSLEKMLEKMEEGMQHLKKAITLTPERKRDVGKDMARLGEFICHCITTAVNAKKWWLLKSRLYIVKNMEDVNAILNDMVFVAENEMRNAEKAIPLVEEDSRLGWEPSMEYMCDPMRIRWKIRQVRNVIYTEIPELRETLNKRDEGK